MIDLQNLLHQHQILSEDKKAENYNNMFTFLHQTDKFIITGDMAAQTFWQWSDDIKPKDDITPFDGSL